VGDPPPPDPASASEGASDAGEDDGKRLSLTFSPLHLIMPMFEVMGEYRVAPGFGAALIAGAGKVGVEIPETLTTAARKKYVGAYEVGAQAAWYPLQPFDSLELGAELLYVYLDASDLSLDVSATANGLAIGPFVGYKFILDVGFTGLIQLGGQYVTARASGESSEGDTAEASKDGWIVLLNLNVGWSF